MRTNAITFALYQIIESFTKRKSFDSSNIDEKIAKIKEILIESSKTKKIKDILNNVIRICSLS